MNSVITYDLLTMIFLRRRLDMCTVSTTSMLGSIWVFLIKGEQTGIHALSQTKIWQVDQMYLVHYF